MKKIFVLFLTVAMVLSMGVTAFAGPGNFLDSPSKNKAPEVIEGNNTSPDCDGYIVVTPYADRATLNAEKLAAIEKAYEDIVAAEDLTDFNAKLLSLVDAKEIPHENLAVSDLFDVSYYGCDKHDDHADFNIKLKCDKGVLEGFVGLLHFTGGKWVLVEDAKVEADILSFKAKDLSPFAIVVETENPPQTGDSTSWRIYLVLMIVSAAALAVVGYKLKKSED